jgi:hypothetical protein
MYSILNLLLFNLSVLSVSFLFSRIKKFDLLKILFFTTIFSFYFGLRPLNVGSDTLTYYSNFIEPEINFEIGFSFLNRILFSLFGPNHQIYFFIINFVMIFNLLTGFRLIIKKPIYIFSAWIIVSLPYSLLMQISVIRQGLALSFYIIGLSLFLNKKQLFGSIFFIISTTLHISMLIYVISYSFTLLLNFKKFSKFILLFVFLLVALSGTTLYFINSLGIDYLNNRLYYYLPYYKYFNSLFRIFFYLGFYLIIDNFMFEKGLSINKQISLLYYVILSSGILILENEIYSARFLISLDFILVIFLLLKSTHFKNKGYLIFSFLIIFILFIVSLYSNAFEVNFLL